MSYWPDDNITLKLNSMEAGWLLAELLKMKDRSPAVQARYMKRGDNDEAVPTTLPDYLSDKLMDAILHSPGADRDPAIPGSRR